MNTDVIGGRYRLGGVVTCTPESTTWMARDTWLDERVLVVMPEPGCDTRFETMARAVVDRDSASLLRPYDLGTRPGPFVVFGFPATTFSDAQVPCDEEAVLVSGRELGDALDALHARGVVHGDLHPGSIAVKESGDAALSPWPLAPRPQNWIGPGGFGSDPEEWRDVSALDDLRSLGAVLLGSLAGPPVLSNEQVENIERELADRAPTAVAIADRALTSPSHGGYEEAAELRDDCVAALSGQPVGLVTRDGEGLADEARTPASLTELEGVTRRPAASEGRRAALVVAATGTAVLTGLGVSGALGVKAGPAVHPTSTQASDCAGGPIVSRCVGAHPFVPTDRGNQASSTRPGAGTPAKLADHPVVAQRAGAASSGSSGSGNAVSASAGTTTTTPSTSSTSTSSTSTSKSTTSTSTTSTSTTTSTPSSTTTSSSDPSSMQAGTAGQGSRTSGSGGSGEYARGSGG